jgi:hypothetical protein
LTCDRFGFPGSFQLAHAVAERGYQALERAYRQRETVFAQTMTDQADWEAATRAQRQLAVLTMDVGDGDTAKAAGLGCLDVPAA